MHTRNDHPGGPHTWNRRKFLRRATGGVALAAGLSLPVPEIRGSTPREFKVGLVGCGSRGSGAAMNAVQAGAITGDTVRIHAVADVFADKVRRPQRLFKVPASKVFVGFDAYRRLLETDCDYVILATPPHFRPEQFEAAIAAGKHVFTEKPVAVDAPGIRRFLAAGESAGRKRLSVTAGTQRRHQKQYIENQERIAAGAIGDIVAGRCYWNTGGLWTAERQDGWGDMEWQLRDWLYFNWLSGDHIVEQHVHNLDVINWFIGAHPIAARGIGGREVRKGRPSYGNIFDHFATELIYANPNPANGNPDVRVISMARQIEGCWYEVSEVLVGTRGSCKCGHEIQGASPWKWSGEQVPPYVKEHVDLIESVKESGPYYNEAANVATSTMTAILARTSCYTGAEVRWDEAMQSNERLGPEIRALGPAPEAIVPRPGKPM